MGHNLKDGTRTNNEDRLALMNEPSRRLSNGPLGCIRFSHALLIGKRWGTRKGSPMDPLEYASLGQLVQITPDRILRDFQVGDQIGSQNLAIPLQQLNDRLLTFLFQHSPPHSA